MNNLQVLKTEIPVEELDIENESIAKVYLKDSLEKVLVLEADLDQDNKKNDYMSILIDLPVIQGTIEQQYGTIDFVDIKVL